jgi:hypothetical protein
MGLNVNSLAFLLRARARGISFDHVLKIGRQSLAVTAADIRRLLKREASAANLDWRRLALGSDVYAEQFFELCGATTVESMDKTNYEGATVLHDLNLPVPETLFNRYDLIVDGGSLEHIFNVPVALRTYMKMLKVGGHYVCNTATNNYAGHGFYQLGPELFFAAFAPENGFILIDACLYEDNGKNRWYRLSPPADARRRLTFQNSVPAHLLILAKKIADTAVFEQVPQQRMYDAEWAAPRDGRTGRGALRSILFGWLGYLPPRVFWWLLNTWNVRNRFRKDMFTRVG